MCFGGHGFIDVEMTVSLMSIIIIVFIVIIIDFSRLLVSDELECYVLKHDCIYVTVSIALNCVEIRWYNYHSVCLCVAPLVFCARAHFRCDR